MPPFEKGVSFLRFLGDEPNNLRCRFLVGPCLGLYGHNSHMSIFARIDIDYFAHGSVRIGYQSIFLNEYDVINLQISSWSSPLVEALELLEIFG